jgi:hypothetical protein
MISSLDGLFGKGFVLEHWKPAYIVAIEYFTACYWTNCIAKGSNWRRSWEQEYIVNLLLTHVSIFYAPNPTHGARFSISSEQN